jgi:hypothetical protein
MYEAVSFWFGLCTEGEIELGWRDPATKALNRFKRFSLTDIEPLVTFAYDVNIQPGANMYFRVCTLKSLPGPTTDEHFLQAPGAHIDHDDAGSVARLSSHPLPLKPAYLVITGRDPEIRGQTFWPVDEPITDPAIVRELNGGLAQFFGGDPAVVNPTRLMRLPGSIAWPVKKGRKVAEITQLLWPADQRSKRLHANELLNVIRAKISPLGVNSQPSGVNYEMPAVNSAVGAIYQEPVETTEKPWQPPVRQNAPISELISATRQPGQWHSSVLRLVASWLNRGLSDKEIHLFAPALTLPGFTLRQTHEELQAMIDGGRQKWDLPDRDPFVDAVTPKPRQGLWMDAEDEFGDIPTRPWLVPGVMLRGSVTLLSGQGAGGKSSYVVGLTLSMAAGIQYGKAAPIGPLRGINYNTEDDRDEQRRRYTAFVGASGAIPKEALKSVIRVGPEGVGTLFQRDPDTGEVTPTDALDDLKTLIIEQQADYLFVDPLAELHTADENDNTSMRSILAAFRQLAKELDIAVVILHHDRKGVGIAGDVDRMRGASALQGAARIVLTLTRMTDEEAQALGIPPEQKSSFIRIDNAKANYTPLGEAAWYQLQGQTIPNGEQVAAALPWSPPDRIAALTGEMKLEILRLMLEAGPERCRTHHHSQDYAPRWIAPLIGCDEKLVKQYLDACIKGGAVKIDKTVTDPADRHPRPAYVVDRVKFSEMQRPAQPVNPDEAPF